jgi:hypothetical protein
MSYLDPVRLVFFGDFQADVSTVNNDVRHYDNATFEKRFQDLQDGRTENGWWRPTGSGAFRLINCSVQAVHYADGSSCEDASGDPVVGQPIGGSTQRVSGKIVDLDPQWQLASQLWGLEVNLVSQSGGSSFGGQYEAAAFRDIVFGRQVAGNVNGQGAAAVFESVLTEVGWGEDHGSSRALRELRERSVNGMLSIRLTTFGYYTIPGEQRFTLGTVSGVIGPARDDEPRSFVAGRRFAPANGNRTSEGVSFFSGLIDRSGNSVLVDLSNAIPLTDPFGGQKDIGALELAILNDESIREGQTITDSQAIVLGRVPYLDKDWLKKTSGIYSAALSGAAAEAAKEKPLALLAGTKVVIRESQDGFQVRAEEFVQRLDAGETGSVEFFVTQRGAPVSNSEVTVTLLPPQPNTGGGSPTAPNQPKAPLPVINTPPEALTFKNQLTTDDRGRAILSIETSDPGNPRGYIDGQIYLMQYALTAMPNLSQQQFDLVIVHLRDTYKKPDEPNWIQDIGPILTQYGNLYPVMNERIVDLTDYEDVTNARAILTLALSLPATDPNHMPVTRDLSAAKRDTILSWLNEKDAAGNYIFRYGTPAKAAEAAAPRALAAVAAERPAREAAEQLFPEDVGGKTDFLRSLPEALRNRRSK